MSWAARTRSSTRHFLSTRNCAVSWEAICLTLLMTPGCRADERCSRCSPNSTLLPSRATWPRPPNGVPRGWRDGAEVDLDTECRTLTLRVLGRSVLGLDLDERADALAAPLVTVVNYVVDRALRPVRAPRWLPTPARHRARAASSALHRTRREILQACRADPTRDAPLVHALIAATDPETGQPLSDEQICHELVVFLRPDMIRRRPP